MLRTSAQCTGIRQLCSACCMCLLLSAQCSRNEPAAQLGPTCAVVDVGGAGQRLKVQERLGLLPADDVQLHGKRG